MVHGGNSAINYKIQSTVNFMDIYMSFQHNKRKYLHIFLRTRQTWTIDPPTVQGTVNSDLNIHRTIWIKFGSSHPKTREMAKVA